MADQGEEDGLHPWTVMMGGGGGIARQNVLDMGARTGDLIRGETRCGVPGGGHHAAWHA